MKKHIAMAATALSLLSMESQGRCHGPFIGVGIAGVGYTNDANIEYNPVVVGASGGPTVDRPNHDVYNAQLDLLAGYATLFERFYFAIVGEYLTPSAESSTNFVTNNPNVGSYTFVYKLGSRYGTWGAAVRLGYQFWEKFVGYFRIGSEYRTYRMYFDPADGFPSIDRKINMWGIVPGLGAEYCLFDHFFVGMEYRGTFYAHKTTYASNALNGNIAYRLRARTDTVALTARFQF